MHREAFPKTPLRQGVYSLFFHAFGVEQLRKNIISRRIKTTNFPYGVLNCRKEKFMNRLFVGLIVGFAVILFIAFCMWAFPTYGVWSQEMRGRAELARATQSKQIMMIHAQAMLEAEEFNAKAEVVRARGMAEAMEIEGGSLTMMYIYYLWVRTMAGNPNIVYIATEASLPILELRR